MLAQTTRGKDCYVDPGLGSFAKNAFVLKKMWQGICVKRKCERKKGKIEKRKQRSKILTTGESRYFGIFFEKSYNCNINFKCFY